ncbi:MAG: ABC transporter substrate-binding protein [Firmicutes bacterium]|nr:ABC transporter substrate-binding protein [Bacillota bacterium]MDD3297887.1 ABC transporter substrate-binding protein [Bacillota bacterium]
MIRKTTSFVLIVLIIFNFCGCATVSPVGDVKDTREITDLSGRKVAVPANPSRIAAMTGPSYEMVFMLGGHDRIAMTKSGHTTNYPLALLTNPDLANYEGIGANPSSSVNIEDYLSREIDLVIYYNNGNELKKFEAVGIPSIVLTLNTGPFSSVEDVMAQDLDEYIDSSTIAVKALADVLGGEAVEEAEKWGEYCTEKIEMLYQRTHHLTDDQRKTVFWGNTWGENILASYPLDNRYYEIWLCGGKLVGPEAGAGNFPEVTKEQLFDWDPDLILVDNHGNYPELVIKSMYKEGSLWETLSAVKNKQLYRIPAGVFFLDKGTTTTLMLLWLAAITQPELFEDIDMIEEIKYYYKEFYEYDLTDEQAQRVLDGWYERLGDEPDL